MDLPAMWGKQRSELQRPYVTTARIWGCDTRVEGDCIEGSVDPEDTQGTPSLQ